MKGIYRARHLETLSQEFWYLHGNEFVEEMNLNDPGHCLRFEEGAIKLIEKRLAFECFRQLLLLMKRSDFASYVSKGPPALIETREQEARTKLGSLIRSLEQDTEYYLNSFLGSIKMALDDVAFNPSRFLVMDVEHIHVTYPSENQGRLYNFPCIFTHIIWRGPREGISTKINAFALPCHACDEDCKHFKKNTFRYDCLSYGHEFFDREISMIENLLARYDGFKLYSYGKSDISQLEQCANFFRDTFQMKRFHRRNRKRVKRVIDVSEDLEVPGKSLTDVEEETIKKWLTDWARMRDHVQVNRRFMIRSDSRRWKDRYLEALESSISDTVSAFLYLVYSKFLGRKDNITIPKQLDIFDIA
ncbi:MAG: hypothetical protein KAR39_02865 [Thermoplasmata archaeon]|nr:hypothetical protein [Thermoplasmata archaeon]